MELYLFDVYKTIQSALYLSLIHIYTMVLRTEWLLEIVSYVRERLPEIKRITSYGRANTLAKISEEDYRALRQAGLDRIHSGYESGSDKVLRCV